jgi:hypothetical protein
MPLTRQEVSTSRGEASRSDGTNRRESTQTSNHGEKVSEQLVRQSPNISEQTRDPGLETTVTEQSSTPGVSTQTRGESVRTSIRSASTSIQTQLPGGRSKSSSFEDYGLTISFDVPIRGWRTDESSSTEGRDC